MQMFNVYCNGRWVTYEWAYTPEGAIAKARGGETDNAVWLAGPTA